MRLVLLAIGAVIIIAIIWDGMRRKKQQMRQGQPSVQSDESSMIVDRNQVLEEDLGEPDIEILEQEAIDIESAPAREPLYHPMRDKSRETPRRPVRVEVVQEINEPAEPEPIPESPVAERRVETPIPEIVWFSLTADEEQVFGGFSLLQILLANGFRFGDDHLFHYHMDRKADGKKLFALAAATNEGTFDLSNMARFSCKGLIVFLETKGHPALSSAFNEMIEVVESLAEDLDAGLFIEKDQAWTPEAIDALRASLRLPN